MKNIYLCYAPEDIASASEIQNRFTASNLDCSLVKFEDGEYLVDFPKEMLSSIRDTEAFVLLLTEKALQSQIVSIQIVKAVSLNKPCFAIKAEKFSLDRSSSFSLSSFELYSSSDIEKLIRKLGE